MLESLLNNWQWYGIGGAALFGAASYFLGIGAILRIVASIIEILTPLIRGVFEAIIEWIKIMYAGLGNIFGSWKTVVTVLSLLAIAFATAKVPAKVAEVKCEQAKQELRKQVPKPKPKPTQKKQTNDFDFRWPWEY